MCDGFPRKFDVQTSYKPSNYTLGQIFVVIIQFPRATYHSLMHWREELYCLNGVCTVVPNSVSFLEPLANQNRNAALLRIAGQN